MYKREHKSICSLLYLWLGGLLLGKQQLFRSWHLGVFRFGRRRTGHFDLRKLDDTKIHASAKATELKLLERAKTLLIERRERRLLPYLTEGVSAAGI